MKLRHAFFRTQALHLLACFSSICLLGAPGAAAAADASPAAIQASINYAKQNLPAVSPELIRAAAKEGKLMLNHMAWGPEQAIMLKQFNAAFPFIKVDTSEGSGGQQLARFQAEFGARRGEGDVFQVSNVAAIDALVAQNAVLKHALGDDALFGAGDKSTGYWYSIHNTTPLIAYRKGALTPAELTKLSTWEGALDPVFKGRVGVPDVSSGGLVVAGYYLFRTRYGKEYFTKLSQNQPKIYVALNPSLDALVAGEVDFILMASVVGSTRHWANKAPINFIESSPKWGSQTPQFISAYAPNPNAAKLYQEWSFSKPVQELWQKLVGAPSARKGVADTRPYIKEPWFKSVSETTAIDWDQVGKNQKLIFEEFNQSLKKRK